MRRLVAAALAIIFSSAFADTKTFNCEFPRTASDKGGLQRLPKPFSLTFLVDTDAGKAYVIGNNGSNEVMLVPNRGGFSLIEFTGTGNVMVTAVTFGGAAVHSRQTILDAKTLVPSQYYGSCVGR
jgi:hypothetical protein